MSNAKKQEENNGMGKTSNIVKITRDSKGTFHARMGKIKDRKSKDLIDAEDIKKRWARIHRKRYKKKDLIIVQSFSHV